MKSKVVRGAIGFVVAFLLFMGLGYLVLYKQFLYPAQEVINWDSTRVNAVEVGINKFRKMEYPKQSNLKEFNKSKEDALGFLNKVSSLLEVEIPQVDALNKYGQVFKNPSEEGIKVNSRLSDGQKLKITVPDYTKIKPSKSEIKKLMDFGSDDELYGLKLEGIFLKYLNNLKDIPTKVVDFTPEYQQKDNGFILNEKSIDNLVNLFYETDDFKGLMKRFAEVSIYGDPNPDLKYWKKKYKDNTAIKPEETIGANTVRCEWLYWNSLKNKAELTEPAKKLTYFYMNHQFLINTSGEVGNGSYDFKASFGVPVRTYFEDSEGLKTPVQVTLLDSYEGEDAIKFLERIDTRNRGLQSSSKLDFYVLKYKLDNLSTNGVINPKGIEGFAMSDKQGNLSARTGRMFGLNEMSKEGYVLNAGESGELVFWTAIPDLNNKELAWGTSFKNKEDILWFNKFKAGYEKPKKESKTVKVDVSTVENTEVSE